MAADYCMQSELIYQPNYYGYVAYARIYNWETVFSLFFIFIQPALENDRRGGGVGEGAIFLNIARLF